ncbi:hypothetical protein Hanom_Chr08g00697891 [Helianthus anomalus]
MTYYNATYVYRVNQKIPKKERKQDWLKLKTHLLFLLSFLAGPELSPLLGLLSISFLPLDCLNCLSLLLQAPLLFQFGSNFFLSLLRQLNLLFCRYILHQISNHSQLSLFCDITTSQVRRFCNTFVFQFLVRLARYLIDRLTGIMIIFVLTFDK